MENKARRETLPVIQTWYLNSKLISMAYKVAYLNMLISSVLGQVIHIHTAARKLIWPYELVGFSLVGQ